MLNADPLLEILLSCCPHFQAPDFFALSLPGSLRTSAPEFPGQAQLHAGLARPDYYNRKETPA